MICQIQRGLPKPNGQLVRSTSATTPTREFRYDHGRLWVSVAILMTEYLRLVNSSMSRATFGWLAAIVDEFLEDCKHLVSLHHPRPEGDAHWGLFPIVGCTSLVFIDARQHCNLCLLRTTRISRASAHHSSISSRATSTTTPRTPTTYACMPRQQHRSACLLR